MAIRGSDERSRASRSARGVPRPSSRFTPLFLLALAFGMACGSPEQTDPRLRERVVSIDGAALGRVLENAAALAGTPAAHDADRWRERTRGCSEVWAHWPDDDDDDTAAAAEDATDSNASPPKSAGAIDPSRLGCLSDEIAGSELARFVRERRGDADGFVSWPIGRDGALALHLDVSERGGLRLEAFVDTPTESGAAALFVPGHEAPAPPVLDASAALIHAHARPAQGLQLSRLIPSGGQADQLFALKGRLLEGVLFEGTWELALLPPIKDGVLPLAVGALHHRLEAGLREALDEALDQLEATWPIERSPRSFRLSSGANVEGGCFTQLPLLPELAPCWVVTPEALLIGYRAEAIDRALARPLDAPARTAARDASLGTREIGAALDVHFDRLQAVDRRLLGAEQAPHLGDRFERLEVRGGLDADDRIAIVAQLREAS